MALSAEEAVARVPDWAGAGSFKISSLGGGITNQNFRVDVNGGIFALRIPGENTQLLGIDREQEYMANLRAGQLGLAPEVIYFIRPEGCLVTRFIPGRPIPPEEMRQKEQIGSIAALLRQVHSLPDLPGSFSVFRTVDDYTQIARRFQVAFPAGFEEVLERMHRAERALHSKTPKNSPCHNDLLNGNFLFHERIYLLDWEYAGMGDVFFDLANFSRHHELSEEQNHWLLESYFGTISGAQSAHLRIMQVLSDLREGMWGLVQMGISKLEFDFQDYAEKFLNRVIENIHSPEWGKWVEEVSNND